MKHTHSFIVLFSLLLINSCTCNSIYNNRLQDKYEAQSVTEGFYGLTKLNDYNEIYSLLSDQLSAKSDTAQFFKQLKNLDSLYGKIDSTSVVNSQTNVVEGTNPHSNYVLVYYVRRPKLTSKETFALTREKGQLKIYNYNIEQNVLNTK